MTIAHSNIIAGVTLAVVATLSWALNFVAPYVTGAYSIYDLMVTRFLIAGALGVGVVVLCRAQLRFLRRNQQLLAASLGVIGYLGYSTCIAAGVIFFGGPVLTPAFIGMVPVLLALLSNATKKTLPWRRLTIPLTFFLTGGLLLSSISSINQPIVGNGSWLMGLFFNQRRCLVARIQLAESECPRETPGQCDGYLDRSHDGGRRNGHSVRITGCAGARPSQAANPWFQCFPGRTSVRLGPRYCGDVVTRRCLGLERSIPSPSDGAFWTTDLP